MANSSIKPAQFESFAPFGREYFRNHPFGQRVIEDEERKPGNTDDETLLPHKETSTSTSGQTLPHHQQTEKWKLYYGADDDDGCEELYCRGRTVIWSRGTSEQSRVVIKTLTVDSDVMDCLWCRFTLPLADQDIQEPSSCRSLCVFENEYLNVFNTDGITYTGALPFLVHNAWPVPGGLMLERTVTPTEMTGHNREVPTLFTLLHPIDEPRPVTSQAHGKVAYICDPTMNVLFTSEEPPLVMMYDSVIGLHSIWVLGKAVPEDVPQSPCTPNILPDNMHHPSPIMTAVAHSRLSLATPTHSPFRPYTPSPSGRPHMQSPVPLRLMSPALGQVPPGPTRSPFLESPLLMSARSPSVFRSPPGGCAREESFIEGFEPLAPEICLKLIWQEAPTSVRHGAKGKASKTLVTTDVFGNTYVCYLVQHNNRLRMLKMLSSDDSKQLVFVPLEEIHAKDMIELKKLNMLLVLGLDSSLTLYSGPTKACTIHLPSIMRGPVTPGIKEEAIDEVMLLSPPHDKSPDVPLTVGSTVSTPRQDILALRDPHPFGCNLVFSDGSTYKLLLPRISESTEVSCCIKALKCLLPAPVAAQFMLGYYQMTNHNSDRVLWELPTEHDRGMEGFVSCLQSMLGYGLSYLQDSDEEMKSDSPAAKKSRTEQDIEGDVAWEWLMNSDYHHRMCIPYEAEFPSKPKTANVKDATIQQPQQIKLDERGPLLNHMPVIVFALHLVYEDLKLDIFARDELTTLAKFLYKLSRDLGWEAYTQYYCRDFPSLVQDTFAEESHGYQVHMASLKTPDFVSKEPPSIHHWLASCLRGEMQRKPFPLIVDVCKQTYYVTMLYSLFVPLREGSHLTDTSKLYSKLPGKGIEKATELFNVKLMSRETRAERVVVFMAKNGLTTGDLDCLPFGVALPLKQAVHMCKQDPPFDLSQAAYTLIGREDLAAQASAEDNEIVPLHAPLNKHVFKEGEKNDGMEFNQEILKLRFGNDLRVQEVRRLLQSSKPVRVSLTQKPEVSDHDFIQEQETKLLMMCKRTMALSVGRGMFTLATSRPVLTETLPIPTLDLTGRAPPRNTIVGLDHVDTPSDMKVWPQFHNGVAAGLRIAPGISQIDSTWIVYNKPKELTNEHSGFLMALGLNGHLNSLSYMNLHDYLCKGHELTTVGLLLGISAARRGSMHLPTTKVLSIHVDALLPPTSAELDVPHSAQVAGVLGVGLVYQATAHRRMAEILLSEIGRPAGPEMENAVNRESYSLAAGLALGLVMLQHGNEAHGVADLKMADQLYHYMVGGQKKPQTGTQKEKFKSPSYLIKEGDTVNIDVTSAGATLALGLMFLKTNNRSVASWLNAPDTQFLLDSVRPDFLLLRLFSRGLIMWDSILPSVDWVETHIPTIVKRYAFSSDAAATKVNDSDIDLETLSQAKANIIAGCCLAMGMRFAGSANQEAFSCLMHYTKFFKDMLSSTVVEQSGKPTLETCMNVALLSVALVMAGTGNLAVLRLVRQLHKRHSADVPYGSHMSVHMALGLLFLGGGRYTLSSSGPAIAALVCALYPKFPISSTDNRYHLQAFRHLYVLAAEPRVIVTREVDNNEACYVPLEITLKGTEYYKEITVAMTAPCMIPELHLIKKICVVGPRYLAVCMDLDSNTSIAKNLLSKLSTVFVKRRAGYLSYAEDPKGYRNLLARTFPEQSDKTDVIRSFSSEPQMIALAGLFCDIISVSSKEKERSAFIGASLHECITEEKTDAINLYVAVKQAVEHLAEHHDSLALWELKLVFCFYNDTFKKICGSNMPTSKPLLSQDFIIQCKIRLDNALDQAISTDTVPVAGSVESDDQMLTSTLAKFLIHHNIPPTHKHTAAIQKVFSLDDVVKSESALSMSAVRRLQSS